MITHVDISHNQISENGGVTLARALGTRNTLTEVFCTEIYFKTR